MDLVEPVQSICIFMEEQCGERQPLFLLSTKSYLKLGTIQWPHPSTMRVVTAAVSPPILDMAPLRVGSVMQGSGCLISCVSPKNSVIVTLHKREGAFAFETFDLNAFCCLVSHLHSELHR